MAAAVERGRSRCATHTVGPACAHSRPGRFRRWVFPAWNARRSARLGNFGTRIGACVPDLRLSSSLRTLTTVRRRLGIGQLPAGVAWPTFAIVNPSSPRRRGPSACALKNERGIGRFRGQLISPRKSLGPRLRGDDGRTDAGAAIRVPSPPNCVATVFRQSLTDRNDATIQIPLSQQSPPSFRFPLPACISKSWAKARRWS